MRKKHLLAYGVSVEGHRRSLGFGGHRKDEGHLWAETAMSMLRSRAENPGKVDQNLNHPGPNLEMKSKSTGSEFEFVDSDPRSAAY